MEERKRIYAIDNIKGIMIFLVVFGHFLLSAASRGEGLAFDIYSLIYCFHMPMFMFLSGYLTHNTTDVSFKKYCIIYMIFNSLYFLIGVLYCGEKMSVLNPAYSMWYILLLILFRWIIRCMSNRDGLLLFVISMVAYVILPLCNIGTFFVHIKFATFFIYFVLGYLSQNLFTVKFYESRKKKEMLVAFVIFCVSVYLMFEMVNTFNLGFSFLNHATAFTNFGMVIVSLFSLFLNIIFIYAFMYAMPNKKLLCISMFGSNSLYIFLLHRIVTLYVYSVVSDVKWICFSLVSSILVCLCFGSTFFVNYIKDLLSFVDRKSQSILSFIMVSVMFLCAASAESIIEVNSQNNYPEILQSDLNDCVKLSYIGDMLLFEEDIVRANNNANDFSKIFEYTKPYFGDYTLGVFEGVVSETEYSTGNYYDNKSLHLKYPVSFAKVVADNVDFVTLGMNHLMDDGIRGVNTTISVFNRLGLDYTGAYTSLEDNNSVKVVNVDGLNIAILAYSDIMNYTDGIYPYTYNSFEFEAIKADIEQAKSMDVDLIIAMTHIGTQFNHGVDARQKYWNNIFVANGVDIVLSDHAHVVEPIEYRDNTVIINCPGNYYTSLSGEDQEYGSICNLYIDKATKRVVSTSIVPIKSVVTPSGGMVVPLFDINDINGTNLVLDNMIDIRVNSLLPEYFYSSNGYNLYVNDTINFDCFDGKKVCFIGDSITDGTLNNGHGWFETISSDFVVVAKGGATSVTIQNLLQDGVPSADVYVLAIGCNDIRYSNTPADVYLDNIQTIVDMIDCDIDDKLYFVSPWYTLPSDGNSILSYEERNHMIEVYNDIMSAYCLENGYQFVDMYTDLKLFFENCDNSRLYMVDGVHPNANEGVALYGDIFIKNIK